MNTVESGDGGTKRKSPDFDREMEPNLKAANIETCDWMQTRNWRTDDQQEMTPSQSNHSLTTENSFRISILDLPPEIHVEIATYLGTSRNLANFKSTCTRIYNVIESAEKVDRKRLPHLKIQTIEFDYVENLFKAFRGDYSGTTKIYVNYWLKPKKVHRQRYWDFSDPSSTKLHILIRHWIVADNCGIEFASGSLLSIPLLKSLSEINYRNAIQCEIGVAPSNPSPAYQKALPYIHEFLKKVQPVKLHIIMSQIPLDGALQILTNLKRLKLDGCSPFLMTHEGLLPLVRRPNFTVQIGTNTNISVDGFRQIVQAWKRADLSAEQLADTKWELVLGPNIDSNELRTAIIRNQGELLGNPSPLLWFKRQTGYKILFKNDIRPQTTLTIDLYTIESDEDDVN